MVRVSLKPSPMVVVDVSVVTGGFGGFVMPTFHQQAKLAYHIIFHDIALS